MCDVTQGSSLELLSSNQSAALQWKVHQGVQRVYDKALRSFVYQLPANGSQAVMQLPRDGKDLGLVQPFLVFQLFLPQNGNRPFSVEVAITDTTSTRRWLLLGAASQEAQTNIRHARLPLLGLARGSWFNLCLDLHSLVDGAFGQVVKSVDGIVIHPECRLRKIFTLRSLPGPEVPKCLPEADCPHDDRRAGGHLPDFCAGVESMHVMSAEQVPNLCNGQATGERELPKPQPPAEERAQLQDFAAMPEAACTRRPRRDTAELPDACGTKKLSTAVTIDTKAKAPRAKAAPAPGSAGACYGRRPTSKQKRVENAACQSKARGSPTARKLRPLPLEIRKEDFGNSRGASQPSSSGSTSVGSRRGRKPSKCKVDEAPESISPSPTAAYKRRLALAMKTLHKTAEIYGAPDAVGHTLRPQAVPRLERASDTQVPPGREAQASLPNPLEPDAAAIVDVPPKAAPVDAWSALSTSVRHGDGPTFAELFRAGRQSLHSGGSTDKILSAEALCQVSVSSKVFGDVLCASDLGSACDTKVKQIQNTVVKESSDVQRSRITARSLPRMSLQESESAYNWDEVPTESVSEEEWLEEEIDAEVSTPEAGSLRPAQEERRIKSMSPARRWRRPRPQPFLHLEKALNTVQPSSAPADADRPLAQLNGGLGEEAPPEAEKREAQPEPRGEEALTHLRPLKSNVWYM
mmetsp:Transcript_17377/g.41161  ORF Transcript_17377/g.41161 Transcript_17377/m.41161 type:complete len:691 (+) Transcript_17377:42-2114(+)